MSATPGLPSLGRRAGTAGSFAAGMRSALTRSGHRLTTRSPDDPAIALLDAWAEVLDVLAFYSGRIADEGYLRTATEPLSLVELAATVGHTPGRGRAGATLLAFTLEEGLGAPDLVQVPAGTRVASVPGPGQVPQTYETTADLPARPGWNAVPARSRRHRPPAAGDTGVYVAGVRADLRAGDAVLVVGREQAADPAGEAWAFRLLSAVEPDPAAGLTRARWADPLGDPPAHSGRAGREVVPAPPDARVYALRVRAAIFGAAAPDHRLIDLPADRATPTFTTAVSGVRPKSTPKGPDWPGWSVQVAGQPPGTVDLDGVHPGIVAGSWVVLARDGASAAYRVQTVQEVSRTDYTLTAKVTRMLLAGPSVAATFGDQVRQTTAYVLSESLPPAAAPEPLPVGGDVIALAHPVPALPGDRQVVVRGPRPVVQVGEGVYHLVVSVPGRPDVPLHPGDLLDVVGATGAAGGAVTWHTTRGTVTAGPEQVHLVPPAEGAVPHSEMARTLAPDPGASQVGELRLTGPLTGCYDPATVRVLANVAPAGHGQTHEQVLGSGDATRTYQRFTLSGSPLTYRTGPGGEVVSTLRVRVDGRQWVEVAHLLGAGPNEEVFVTELDAAGTVTVRFGDGRTGARLPTGTGNVTARYRVGTGLAGQVGAGQLTQLMTRPLGVRAVTNPRAAGTAADPDPAGDVRAGTARTALTLDRVVSLADVENFARAVPGVGKALATRIWDGRAAVVHLTVAGPLGEVIDDQALTDLASAVRAAGLPRLTLTVQCAQVVEVPVTATVVVDPAHDPGLVVPAATAAVARAGAAGARALGGPFRLGDLVRAVHQVPGVLAVRVSQPGQDVPALPARRTGTGFAPAQLVALAPGGPDLTEVTG